MDRIEEYLVAESELNTGTATRLDVFLAAKHPELSRSYIQKLISDDGIKVNRKKVKAGLRLQPGDNIQLVIPQPQEVDIKAQDVELDVCYEDTDLLVVNKPQGMVVHPAAGNTEGTLVNALLHHCKDLSGINGELRPGIVHRIDKDTSGLLVVAKHDSAHWELAAQLKRHSMKRVYTALVEGIVTEEEGRVDAPIGRHPRDRKKMAVVGNGKEALTHYNVLERFHEFTLLEVKLETGRTHQIRVHLAFIGHPVAGDTKYGKKNTLGLAGQALHAGILGFQHPRDGRYLECQAPLPEYFNRVLRTLREGL